MVRISQSWSSPPPKVPVPPVPTPHTCNYTALQEVCPSSPGAGAGAYQACVTCVRHHNKTAKALRCDGANLWPDYCHGVGPSFPDHSGEVDVQVFASTPNVELILNGASLGTQPSPAFNYTNFAHVAYAPGNLTAVGRDASGKELARHTILTAGAPVGIVLSIDAPSRITGTGSALLLDGHDAALVRATVVDAHGATVATADHAVTFLIAHGPGKVVGVHNGDAKSHEPQAATYRHAYHGLARAVVKVTVDSSSPSRGLLASAIDVEQGDGAETVRIDAAGTATPGFITVVASAPGLKSGTVDIPVSSDAAMHSPLAVAAASARARDNVALD